MRVVGISLGSNRGDIEVHGKVDVPNQSVKFQVIVNGLVCGESDDYSEAREFMMEIFKLNSPDRAGMN